tara:strand:+ start:21490 stop:21960 length:471 start_codon:yes stop_codon:yes gene_type:complete
MSRGISGESMSWFDVIKNASSIMTKWLNHRNQEFQPIVYAFPGKDGLIREMFIKLLEDMQYKYRSGEGLDSTRLEEGNIIGEYYLESEEYNNPCFRFQIGPKEYDGKPNRFDDYDRLELFYVYFKECRNQGGQSYERDDWDELISMLLGTQAMGGA